MISTSNNKFTTGNDRIHQIEQALEKLRVSELSQRRITKKYFSLESIVNKQLKTADDQNRTKSRSTLKQNSSKMTISDSTCTSSRKSKMEKQLEATQKRIFQFHDEIDVINDVNSKTNSRKKLFLNALTKTNLDVWKNQAIRNPVRKLENQMNLLL